MRKHLVLVKDRVHLAVQLARRLQVVAEGLFDHHRDLALIRLRHSLRAKIFDNPGKKFRRRGQVEQPLAAKDFFLRDALQLRLQTGIICRIVEVERKVTYVAYKAIQLGVACVHAAKLEDARAHIRRKLIAQRPTRHAHNGKLLRQQPRLLQVKERREQLAFGQVARSAKDHHDPRLGNPLVALRDLGKILRADSHLDRRHRCLTSNRSSAANLLTRCLTSLSSPHGRRTRCA